MFEIVGENGIPLYRLPYLVPIFLLPFFFPLILYLSCLLNGHLVPLNGSEGQYEGL